MLSSFTVECRSVMWSVIVECHCVVSSAIGLCLLTWVVSRASLLCYAACAPGIAASNERV